ncbi:MAG: type I pullulanase [Ruminococcus sp.]|nr:type I pullulanase [Ruminococcus sp.]
MSDYANFDENCCYRGDDLGVTVDGEITRFKVWAPFCNAVFLNLYTDGEGDNLSETVCMRRIEQGVWYAELLHTVFSMYYTYTLEYEYTERVEVVDIYAKGCGINGNRGYIVDFAALNPTDWDKSERVVCKSAVDACIYECNVRDFSISPDSGVDFDKRGRFAAFSQENTSCNGVSTCLEHLKELGITHVQLMPVADFATLDEKKPLSSYNWGYDPKNYMCLEGSYCSDAYDGDVRIREFKQLVASLHKAHIGVILDVVFNHTYFTEKSNFHKTVPYYYHRLDADGKFSNGSGCGNETASEHLMMRKYIVDAIKFWANEYKVDGFRFDLMGLHDIETINLIRDELDKIDPSILMYGEGWTGGTAALAGERLCYKWNSHKFGRIGLFNDNIRDAVKGGTFDLRERGFVCANGDKFNAIRRSVTANAPFEHLNGTADELNWAYTPAQAINYCEAHDNHTLWDKLSICAKEYSEDDRIRMDKLAAAAVLLSQGVPFIQLGQDFLRTKPKLYKENEVKSDIPFDGNSYNAPDETNMIRWERKALYKDVFKYYKALIALRKSSWLFRMSSSEDMNKHLYFHDNGDVISFELVCDVECYFVVLNPQPDSRHCNLPNGEFYTRLTPDGMVSYSKLSGSIEASRISCTVFKRI